MSGLRRARRLDFQQNKIVSREARPPRGPRERPALTRTHTRTRALTCTQQGTGVDWHPLRILLRKAVSHAAEDSAVVLSWSSEPADSELPERVLVTIARRGAQRTPNELSRMFSLFAAPAPARAEATREHLAMMTCRVMVELHAGRIWAANVADGFEVRLWLPRTSDSESVRAGA